VNSIILEIFTDRLSPSYITNRPEETAPLIPPLSNVLQLNAQTVEKKKVQTIITILDLLYAWNYFYTHGN